MEMNLSRRHTVIARASACGIMTIVKPKTNVYGTSFFWAARCCRDVRPNDGVLLIADCNLLTARGRRMHIMFPGRPNVESGQQENVQDHSHHQTSNYDDGERPL